VAIIVAMGAVTFALNFPGHLSYDSVVQLSEGRTGVYSGEHPPVMSWLLGVADALSHGPAVFVAFDIALIFGALLALVRLGPARSWWAAILAALLAFTPQLLIYPAIVWKDVLFAGASIAGFTCLAWAAARWDSPAWRWSLLAGALALLSLAALARQNGAVVLPIAAGAIAWIGLKVGSGVRRAALRGLGFLATSAVIVLASSAALATRLDGSTSLSSAWETLQLYDLTSAVVRDPGVELPVLRARDPGLETALRTRAVAAYSPVRVDSLEPVFGDLDGNDAVARAVAAQWRDLMLRRPWLYLRVRAVAFDWVFLTPRPGDCGLIETGIDGPAEEMRLAGIKPRDTPMDDALGNYALRFTGTPIFSHAAYAGVGLALLVWLLRRRSVSDIAVGAMLASGLTFAASFALISISCDYRYLYGLDLSVIAAALYAAASIDWPRLARAPRAPPG
jgi:uncharacterized protein (TIGR03382 family)